MIKRILLLVAVAAATLAFAGCPMGNRPPAVVVMISPTSPTWAGDVYYFDASLSSDPDGDELTCAWSLVSVPDEASASISDATGATTSLPTDGGAAGEYVVRLVVSDGASSTEAEFSLGTGMF